MRKCIRLIYFSCLILPVTFSGITACSKAKFSSGEASSHGGTLSTQGSKLKDQTVVTRLNTPVTFTAILSLDNGQAKKLIFPNGATHVISANGVLAIQNASALQYTYTPNNGFRGTDVFAIYLLDSTGSTSQATLTVDVANALSTLQPSLATRTTGCIMCHSNVGSNIITDFGYGGDGKGLNYFFGGVAGVLPPGLTNTQGGSMYGDYDFSQGTNVNWGSANITGAKVIVPVAPTTGVQVSAASLAAYLRGILAQSSNSTTQSVVVQEFSSMYIGAPTATRIMQVAGMVSPQSLKFIPEAASSPALSGLGLDPTSSYYTNTAPLVCNGDLVIDGIVWLNNVRIETELGCRLYATKSVFITGPITFTSSNESRNLQITSARAVILGLGHGCSVSGSVDTIAGRLNINGDSRFVGAFTRNQGTPEQMLSTLADDANKIGVLQDATCGHGGRAVGFERLLLNAPVVESRYQGAFSGTIIAEITLTSLESLIYSFDTVFNNVPILPLLTAADYLTISP